MDSGLNAIVLLDVKLGKGVVIESGCIADISKGRCVNDVSYGETLDSFVLRDGLGGRYTSNIRKMMRMDGWMIVRNVHKIKNTIVDDFDYNRPTQQISVYRTFKATQALT